MNHYIWLSLLTFFIIMTACSDKPTNQPSTNWKEAKESGAGMLTALYVPSEGFAQVDQEGNLNGFTVELLRDFADFTVDFYGVAVEIEFIEETNWGKFYNRIKDGRDGKIGLGNVTITAERLKELNFSPPYMNNIASLITHRDAPALEHLSEIGDIWGHMAPLAFEGTLHEDRIRALINQYHPSATIQAVHSNDEILKKVSGSDGYYAYIDLYNYQRGINRGLPLRHHPPGDLSEEEFGYIMPLNSSWSEPIQAWFLADGGLTNSDRYRKLMQEHLGEELAGLLFESGGN